MGNACLGGQGTLYEWKITHISSLLRRKHGVDLVSRTFEAGGYNWGLHMVTTKSEDEETYIAVRLCLKNLPSDSEIKAKYNLIIYNQKHSKHVKRTGTSDFTATCAGGFHYMIPLQTFNDASLGYLMNDTCIFGVDILRVLHTQKSKVASQCLSFCEKTTSQVSWTWKIESEENFKRPHGSSETFYVGGLKWHLGLGGAEKEHLSLHLRLDYWDAIQLKSAVYVEFIACIKSGVKGEDTKSKFCAVFSSEAVSWGWGKFLSYEDLYNPAKGFFIDNTCRIEASVSVIGLVSFNNTLFSNDIDPSSRQAKVSTVRMVVVGMDGSASSIAQLAG